MESDRIKSAVEEAGGKFIEVPLDREKFNQNLSWYAPGCGAPTHVDGTNGGEMPCGGMLTGLDGNTEQYFCALCSPRNSAKQMDGVWIARNPGNNVLVLVELKEGKVVAAAERYNLGQTADGLRKAGWTLWSKMGEPTA